MYIYIQINIHIIMCAYIYIHIYICTSNCTKSTECNTAASTTSKHQFAWPRMDMDKITLKPHTQSLLPRIIDTI